MDIKIIVIIVLAVSLAGLGVFTYNLYSKAVQCKAGIEKCIEKATEIAEKVKAFGAGLQGCFLEVQKDQDLLLSFVGIPTCSQFLEDISKLQQK